MALPHGTATPPSTRHITSQTTVTISRSTAKRYVFRGQKLELLKNKQVKIPQSQLEYNQARNSVSFHYSPRSAVCESTSATDTAIQTAQATPVYARNTAFYLHFVERKLKLASSKIDLCRRELHSTVSLLCDKIDSYTFNLEARVTKMRFRYMKNHITKDQLLEQLDLLNAKKNAYTDDLKRKLDLLHAKKASYRADIVRQLELVKSKSGPFAERLGQPIRLLESKIDSYTFELEEKVASLHSHHSVFTTSFSEDYRCIDM